MKTIQVIIFSFLVAITSINTALAAGEGAPTGLLKGIGHGNDGTKEGVTASDRIRTGDIHIDDIPNIIQSLIEIFLGIAGTVAVIFVIIGAYKILFGSLQQDITKGRDTIIMALTGFAFATLAWFIVKFIFTNFGA